jgi:environmental stress-induced protein Ves
LQLFRLRDHRVVPWKNGRGSTIEIAVEPPDGSVQRGFDWRLSMATIDEDGPFSSFPGVDRVLVVLDGEVDLVSPEATARLGKHAVACFPGEREITARVRRGPVRDVNVMVRRSAFTCDPEVRRIRGATDLGSGRPILVVAIDGTPTVAGYPLEPGEAVVVEAGTVSGEGDGTVLVARLTPRVE